VANTTFIPRGGATLAGIYHVAVLCYLTSLLFLYPYGIPLSPEVSLRIPDLLALPTLTIGATAILFRTQIRIDRTLLTVVGFFLLMELYLPIVGAVGYRRPVDVLSSLRMAMLWLPMIFLTMLARSSSALRFERHLARLLAVTLWLNLVYAILQIAAVAGLVPRWVLITSWLEAFAVERYDIVQGIRPAGFFNASTSFSVFGIVCLCFFYARFLAGGARQDMIRTLLAVGIVVLSTSRAAFASMAAILFAGWWLLPSVRRFTLLAILFGGAVLLLVVVEETIGIDVAFSRFERLAESGLFEDASFGARVYDIWPTAIAAARDYKLGTLIQAPRTLPLIDSGYLTYYLQGKWVSVAALSLLLAGHWFVGLRAYFGPAVRRVGVMTLFLGIFLTIALAISNPLRSPLVIFFIVYSFWRLDLERHAVSMRACATSSQSTSRLDRPRSGLRIA